MAKGWKYRARDGYPINDEQAEIIGRFIEEEFEGGSVTPDELLNAARDKSSVMHSFFEWDDKKAAELQRYHHASKLIKAIYVKIDDVEVPAFQRVFVKEQAGYRYVETRRAQKNQDLWGQVLSAALAEANGWARRYGEYKQLSPIVIAIKKTEKQINEKSKSKRTG